MAAPSRGRRSPVSRRATSVRRGIALSRRPPRVPNVPRNRSCSRPMAVASPLADAARGLGAVHRAERWRERADARDARDPARSLSAVPRQRSPLRGDGRGAASSLALVRSDHRHVRTRLFHNNTVRTVAPEYEWVDLARRLRAWRSSPNAMATRSRRIAHLYVMDLGGQGHARGARRARRLEPRRRARPARPRAANVRADRIARARGHGAGEHVARIYENERSLFGFDSKHITQAGQHRRRTEWLLQRSIGVVRARRRTCSAFTTNIQRGLSDVANVVATVREGHGESRVGVRGRRALRFARRGAGR